MKRTIITPQQVVDLAYKMAGYTNEMMISPDEIAVAERRYLIPVVGEALYESLLKGEYLELVEGYVAPALALYVREWVSIPSAPRSAEGMRQAREMMRRLSNYLDEMQSSYPEYKSEENALKRCRIDGGFVQIH